MLLERLQQQQQHGTLFALLITNLLETVPFWHQKASSQPDGFVIWDYHVIALQVCPQQSGVLVWDLDLKHPTLQFPCTLQQYAQHALQAESIELPPHYARMYRLVPAASFLQHFASDRSHMRLPDGSWSAQPPQYPCITAADGTRMSLSRYRDMTVDVLQDRLPCQHSSAQHSSQAAVAVFEKGGKHPCQAAACMGTHGSGSGDRQGSSSSSAIAAAAAAGHAEQQGHTEHSQPVAASGSEGTTRHEQLEPASSTGHAVAAGTSSGADADHVGDRLATWQDVLAACGRGKFGVVLHEHTLLRCLLGAAAGSAG